MILVASYNLDEYHIFITWNFPSADNFFLQDDFSLKHLFVMILISIFMY